MASLGPSAAENQPSQSAKVHLLKDLLVLDFPDAKIWNFTHDSQWLIDAPIKTTAEIGKYLLTEIKAKRSSPRLPIIFIGHSLGGIIIKQATTTSIVKLKKKKKKEKEELRELRS
ncbi:hypothetical protein NLG97_g494 [Lecanicillium saksenae]|uniref:Uncharacterized protein n=1 Tax=Lecanicillium saksenae TaxID=468837 RepID=A0ACC1R935_9HYPO|nr:hypothetical protein NLG97_g494 [Lecanicillium saksenae]